MATLLQSSLSPNKERKVRAKFHLFISRPLAGDPRSIFVQERSRVYTQNLMRPKLVIAILVLALSGANSGAASICAAYCMSSAAAGSAAVHHHQMESQLAPTSMSHHVHAHHKGAECAECPPKSGNSLNQQADCTSLVQIEGLKGGSFSLDAPSGVAQFDVADTPAYTLGLDSDGERSLLCDASRTVRSSSSASVPLRI
jgi:hypothetical protein